jgi:hypothetical protein
VAGEPAGEADEVPSRLPSGSPADVAENRLVVGHPSPAAVRESLPLPRWVGPLAIVCALGLVPWIVYLAFNLPQHARTSHYNTAWVGFDVAMCVVLALLALTAWRRHPTTELFAGVAATLLVVDAWFDVVTSLDRRGFTGALLSALLVELPLAVLCTWIAVNAERVRARTYRRLWRRAMQ